MDDGSVFVYLRRGILLGLFVLMSHSVLADIIKLKNGQSLEGKIIAQDEQVVRLRLPSGEMEFKRAEIDEIIQKDLDEKTPVEPESGLEPDPLTPVPPSDDMESPPETKPEAEKTPVPAQDIETLEMATVIEYFERIAKTRDFEERIEIAVEAEAAIKQVEEEALLAVLESGDIPALDWLIRALPNALAGKARPVLVQHLESRDRQVVIAALGKLGVSADPSIAEAVYPLLTRNDDDIVKQAVVLLARIRTRKSIPHLIPLSDHSHWFIQSKIGRLLAVLTGEKFGSNRQAWESWWSRNRLKILNESAP